MTFFCRFKCIIILPVLLFSIDSTAFAGNNTDPAAQKNSTTKTDPTQKCGVDLGYPKYYASKYIETDDPPVSVCWDGWSCYYDIKRNLFYRLAYQVNETVFQEDSVESFIATLSSMEKLRDSANKVLSSLSMLNHSKQIKGQWMINPQAGELIREQRSACFGANEITEIHKLAGWANWYLSQYKATRDAIATSGKKYR